MTTIIFFRDDNDNYIGFEASGHANYRRYGKDIVCASISVLLINLVNSVDELTTAKCSFDSDDNSGYMKFLIEDKNNTDVQLLFKSTLLGLNEIQENYSKYLKLTNRRYKP